jgi:hypothetical protein
MYVTAIGEATEGVRRTINLFEAGLTLALQTLVLHFQRRVFGIVEALPCQDCGSSQDWENEQCIIRSRRGLLQKINATASVAAQFDVATYNSFPALRLYCTGPTGWFERLMQL